MLAQESCLSQFAQAYDVMMLFFFFFGSTIYKAGRDGSPR